MVTLWLTSSLLLKIMFKRGKSTISMCNFHWQTVNLPESSITTLYCEICKMFLFLDHHLFFFPTFSWISSGPTHSSVELVKDPHCHWNWPGISQSHSKLPHRKIPNIFGRSRPSLKVRFFLAGWITINCFHCQFYRMKR